MAGVKRRKGAKTAPIIHQQIFEMRPIDSVQSHPDNPRQGDVGAICSSIDDLGFYGAILVQMSTNFILAGSHRHKSLKLEGATEVPCLVIDVDDETALDIVLRDNRTSDEADYDRSKLPALLLEIRERRGNIERTGFNDETLQQLLDDLKPREEQQAQETEKRKEPNLDPGDDRYKEQYGVIVICKSEAEQRRVFEQLALEYDDVKVVCT